jgi:uncharacterized MAPEG superfamily protein
MTTDLWMLVYSALLCLSIPMIGVTRLLMLPGGAAWGFGNRDEPFAVPSWIERTRRAHMNMVENLAPFACLVLAAHVSGKADATTALGAQIFFVARVAHAAVYIIGIPVLRTLVFGIAVAGELMILARLFS